MVQFNEFLFKRTIKACLEKGDCFVFLISNAAVTRCYRDLLLMHFNADNLVDNRIFSSPNFQ